MKNCTICLMETKTAAVMRALEYDVPIRTLATLLDVSKDVVARHKAHMYKPPPIRRRKSRSSIETWRKIVVEAGLRQQRREN